MLTPFFVWQDKALKRIHPEDVMCLNTEGNYTRIVLSDKSYYLVRSTLSAALEKLPPDLFIRTHRSYAVSVQFIDNVARDHLIIEDEVVPIAKRYYNQLVDQLNIVE